MSRLRSAGCVFAEEETDLLVAAAGSRAELEALVRRRCGGEPLEYILGWVEFCGQRIAIESGVFVPRRRTEFLAEQAIEAIRSVPLTAGAAGSDPVVVVELCCGCGAIGAAVLAAGVLPIELYAVDIDPIAVRCARGNLAGATVRTGDLFDPLPRDLGGRIDLLVANAPYVPSAEIVAMPPEARDHEPRWTLDGGPDGLDVVRRAAAQAPGWLARGGRLLIETSDPQVSLVAEIFAVAGLEPAVAEDPERDAVVVIGTAA